MLGNCWHSEEEKANSARSWRQRPDSISQRSEGRRRELVTEVKCQALGPGCLGSDPPLALLALCLEQTMWPLHSSACHWGQEDHASSEDSVNQNMHYMQNMC